MPGTHRKTRRIGQCSYQDLSVHKTEISSKENSNKQKKKKNDRSEENGRNFLYMVPDRPPREEMFRRDNVKKEKMSRKKCIFTTILKDYIQMSMA